MYGPCPNLVVPPQDEVLLNEAAETRRHCSSNDGDVDRESASLEGLPHHPVA